MIKYNYQNNIGIITLNRPEKRNALHPRLIEQMKNKLIEIKGDENEKDSEKLAELLLMIYNFSKPTIAAVNGAAIAGGCGLASVCDLIVANEEESRFGYSEVKIGFLPAIVSIFIIKRV